MSQTETIYRLLDRDSGTFVRVYGGGGQPVLTVGGGTPVFETGNLSALHETMLGWGKRHPGYDVPDSSDLEGDVDIVRTVTSFSFIGNERVVVSQDVSVVDLVEPVPVRVWGNRPYSSMPSVLLRRYVPDAVAATLADRNEGDVSFFVVETERDVSEGDFVVASSGRTMGSVGRVAHIQALPDDWPAGESTPSTARLALIDASAQALTESVVARGAEPTPPARAL